ncbi:MAG: hypothetical protein NVS1B14_06600 [Vulcanimicrobiaceae bacterium]
MRMRYRVFGERDRGFQTLRGTRVLIYWPHGLGDWVHLSTIIPMLEPSNQYFITRFGDDYVAAFDGHATVAPLFSGVHRISDGSDFGAKHFGLDHRHVRGRTMELQCPPPFDRTFAQAGIEAVLYTDYPERAGRSRFPFHTKARLLAKSLVAPERLEQFDLTQPLKNTLDFSVSAVTQNAVDARLRTLMGPADKLCVLATAGHTNARKNWPAPEAERFVQRFASLDPCWKFLNLDKDFGPLFAGLDLPFARAYRALLARTHLFVGVPAGPLHVAMARADVPMVGIWLAHHPDWYDEPNSNALHLVGEFVYRSKFDRRAASVTKPAALRHRIEPLGSGTGATDAVVGAAQAVLQ